MNRDSLRQALRVHVMRLRQQQLRSASDTTTHNNMSNANAGGFFVSCTVDELVHQVEGALSTEKPDYGFGEALARLQLILGVNNTNNTNSTSNTSLSSHRRGSIGAGSGRRGSISDMIDAEAMVSRHSLKSIA